MNKLAPMTTEQALAILEVLLGDAGTNDNQSAEEMRAALRKMREEMRAALRKTRERLSELESVITWETSCGNCARLLDRCSTLELQTVPALEKRIAELEAQVATLKMEQPRATLCGCGFMHTASERCGPF